jgi:hypothetical protein
MQPLMSPFVSDGVYERGMTWLSKPDDVVAHLFFAAAEIGQIQVDVFGQTITAALAFPHHGSNSIDILFSRGLDALLDHSVVRVRYHHDGSSYEFLTSVQRLITDRRWRLALPNAVSRRISRGADRLSVRRDPRFTVYLERDDGEPMPQQLHDISTTGLSFVFRPAQLTLERADQLLSTLQLPGDRHVPVLLEVRHSRPDGGGSLPVLIAGCHLISISPWGRALLSQAIAGITPH